MTIYKTNLDLNNIENNSELNSKINHIYKKLKEDISTTNLKKIYEENKIEYEKWIFNGEKLKKTTKKTKEKHINNLKIIFKNNIETVYDFIKLRDNNPELFLSRPNVYFRGFIEFCRINGKLNENIALSILKKIKGKVDVNIDNFIPLEKDVLFTLNYLKENYNDKPYYYLVYKLLIESGGRWEGSIEKMFLNFDENRLNKYDKFVVYDINYDLDENNNIILIQDKNKLSFFLFFRLNTFNELIKFKDELKDIKFLKNYRKIFSKIKKKNNEKFVSPKYIRKFVRSKLVECGVSSEFADFIESRKNGSVGFNIYQDKKYALEEYKKYLPYLEKILD